MKKDDHYFLEVEPYTLSTLQKYTIIANTFDKPKGDILQLSLKNCQAIELGYDLDELAKEFAIKKLANPNEYEHSIYAATIQNTYMVGFKKALELLGDKKFSEEDMQNAIYIAWDDDNLASTDIIQSLQQTEWDVSIEMEPYHDGDFINDGKTHIIEAKLRYRLDSDGCLILKRK